MWAACKRDLVDQTISVFVVALHWEMQQLKEQKIFVLAAVAVQGTSKRSQTCCVVICLPFYLWSWSVVPSGFLQAVDLVVFVTTVA